MKRRTKESESAYESGIEEGRYEKDRSSHNASMPSPGFMLCGALAIAATLLFGIYIFYSSTQPYAEEREDNAPPSVNLPIRHEEETISKQAQEVENENQQITEPVADHPRPPPPPSISEILQQEDAKRREKKWWAHKSIRSGLRSVTEWLGDRAEEDRIEPGDYFIVPELSHLTDPIRKLHALVELIGGNTVSLRRRLVLMDEEMTVQDDRWLKFADVFNATELLSSQRVISFSQFKKRWLNSDDRVKSDGICNNYYTSSAFQGCSLILSSVVSDII